MLIRGFPSMVDSWEEVFNADVLYHQTERAWNVALHKDKLPIFLDDRPGLAQRVKSPKVCVPIKMHVWWGQTKEKQTQSFIFNTNTKSDVWVISHSSVFLMGILACFLLLIAYSFKICFVPFTLTLLGSILLRQQHKKTSLTAWRVTEWLHTHVSSSVISIIQTSDRFIFQHNLLTRGYGW